MIPSYSLPVPDKHPDPKKWAREQFSKVLLLARSKHSVKDYRLSMETEVSTRVYFKLKKKEV